MDAFLLSFAVIFVAELGDKSQLMAMAFATRYRAWTVLAAVTIATLLVHAGSVLIGATFALALPTAAIQVAAGIAFFVFAFWTLRGDELGEDDEGRAQRTGRWALLTIGSAFFLVFNGLQGGAVGGYLTARGHGEAFYSFIVTHSAFELTAIVMSGAAGLRLGHALIAPGRRTRLEALRHASSHAIVVMYGVIAFLLIAAAVEAFWSSARWVAPEVKYGVGAACWALVIAYLGWQGRPRRAVDGKGPDAG